MQIPRKSRLFSNSKNCFWKKVTNCSFFCGYLIWTNLEFPFLEIPKFPDWIPFPVSHYDYNYSERFWSPKEGISTNNEKTFYVNDFACWSCSLWEAIFADGDEDDSRQSFSDFVRVLNLAPKSLSTPLSLTVPDTVPSDVIPLFFLECLSRLLALQTFAMDRKWKKKKTTLTEIIDFSPFMVIWRVTYFSVVTVQNEQQAKVLASSCANLSALVRMRLSSGLYFLQVPLLFLRKQRKFF